MANSTFNNLNQLLKTEIEGVDSTQTGTTKIEGRVVDKNIATVHVNGILAEIQGESYSVNEVPLTAGENTITIIATDKAGNETTQNFTIYYDPISQATYQYDKNGNLIQKSEKGTVWSYTWDAENRLIRVTTNNTNDTNKIIEYGYFDGGSNRAYKKVISSQLSVVRYYVHDGVHVIAEYDLQGNLLRENIYTDYIDEVINIKEGTNQYYPIQDGSNSVVAILDSAGNMISDYNYEVFGTIKNKTEGIENNILYTGRIFERETGDYYYRERYYNSKDARFISIDPISFESGDVNLYAYTANDPINYYDPYGTSAWGVTKFTACMTACMFFDYEPRSKVDEKTIKKELKHQFRDMYKKRGLTKGQMQELAKKGFQKNWPKIAIKNTAKRGAKGLIKSGLKEGLTWVLPGGAIVKGIKWGLTIMDFAKYRTCYRQCCNFLNQ